MDTCKVMLDLFERLTIRASLLASKSDKKSLKTLVSVNSVREKLKENILRIMKRDVSHKTETHETDIVSVEGWGTCTRQQAEFEASDGDHGHELSEAFMKAAHGPAFKEVK